MARDSQAALVALNRFGLGARERVLAETVFPGSAPAKPMQGLVGRVQLRHHPEEPRVERRLEGWATSRAAILRGSPKRASTSG
jgi:hypothetical protein